jgi:enterochelin esterase-like enzyme
VNDFVQDVMPYVEKHYRVLTDRANIAIAGLSMGGGHTLHVAIPRLEKFGYIGVYSSGLLGAFPDLPGRGGRLLWFATGKDDFLLTTTAATVELFKKHGFSPVFKESPGGHTWINWRIYLVEFAPMLFQKSTTAP